jgi:hypothetical protein
MARVRVICSACDGKGTLPPICGEGNLKDVRRFFPRPCDDCNCQGFVYVDKNIEEKDEGKNVGNVTGWGGGFYTAQGDC